MTTTVPVFESVDSNVLGRFYHEKRADIDAIETPFPGWNKHCRDEGAGVGLARGWHVILAGNTGSGKSLLGLNMAVCAIRHRHKVCYLSLEMSQRQLLTRFLAIYSGSPVRRFEQGEDWDPENEQRVAQGFEDEYSDCLFVNRDLIWHVDHIVGAMERFSAEGAVLFIIDFLQLAWGGVDHEHMTDRITEVSHAVRGAAQRLRVTSLALSQFNREAAKESKKSPTIFGLFGGSSLEQAADQVVLLDHTNYKESGPGMATQDMILAKNRHGGQGRIPIIWDYSNLQVREEIEDYKNMTEEEWKMASKVPF